jgi:hypothetical protein
LVLWFEQEGKGWKPNEKVDYVRCEMRGDKCWILTSTNGTCLIWELDCRRFVHSREKCFVDYDVDNVVASLQLAKMFWANLGYGG